jgi:alpha-amylase
MADRIRLVLALHNHQPIGNFDGVFEESYQDSYLPFLQILEEYSDIRFSLHTSGSLLEWLVTAHPEYIDQLRHMVQRGQVEIVGGAFYEPILPNIPRRDRIGQIRSYSDYLQQLFGQQIRGMWIPERVWEQSLTAEISAAGIEYTVLDDYHFKCAGMRDEELTGYYVTEDEGALVSVFPGSERLRYTIPFRPPGETIDYMREVAQRAPNAVMVFGDDGEKFGTWPGTKKHVYDDGWLRSFLDALRENQDWIDVTTLGDSVNEVAPLGRVYLPDCSYREMTEWVLPTKPQQEFAKLTHRDEMSDEWRQLVQFTRGGYWRNFRTKYPESNEMYARMLEISERVRHAAIESETADADSIVREARGHLYRAQCNCSYWHGAFGGLYLPHLRNAVYEHLIAADTLLESLNHEGEDWVDVTAKDYNLDARTEVRLASNRLISYFAPVNGGHMYELDIRACKVNLLATLNRREEAYHDKIRAAGEQGGGHGEDDAVSIHDLVRFKQPDLHKRLQYDYWPRKSLVDHFMTPGLNITEFQNGEGAIGDFATGTYQAEMRSSDTRSEAVLSRTGRVGKHIVRLTKTVSMATDTPGSLRIRYELEDLPRGLPIQFGVEYNFAAIPGGAEDRYYYDDLGQQIGTTDSVLSLENTNRIGVVDEWLGLDVAMDLSREAQIWTMPIQTVSQSESGFELVHQNCAVIPFWHFEVPVDGRWTVEMNLSVDTSMAKARELALASNAT